MTGTYEESKFSINQEDMIELREMINIYSSSLKSGVTGAVAGTVMALTASGLTGGIAGELSMAGSVLYVRL